MGTTGALGTRGGISISGNSVTSMEALGGTGPKLRWEQEHALIDCMEKEKEKE